MAQSIEDIMANILQTNPTVGNNLLSGATNQGGIAGLFQDGGVLSKTNLFGDKDSMGFMNGGLGALGAINGFLNGREGVKLARDQFNQNTALANRNLANQAQNYNTTLTNQARARASANPSQFQDINSYLNQNRVDGSPV